MDNTVTARIYGDSLMKVTVMDGACRYHSHAEEMLGGFASEFGMKLDNRARFGYTVKRGMGVLSRDLTEEPKPDCEYALIEFGGNDCDFDWKEVASAPATEHMPFTKPEEFEETYLDMIEELQKRGVKTVLMTLPPIDAERYLNFVSRNGSDPKRILEWLGDVQMIYRFHESYSNLIRRIAQRTKSYLVDVRSYFLDKHNYRELMGNDGIHPTEEGYRLIIRAFEDFAASLKAGAALPATC